MKDRTVILFLCHISSRESAAEYERIQEACGDRYEVLFYFDDSGKNYDETVFSIQPDTHLFTKDSIFGTGYPVKGCEKSYHPGNQDLTILSFYLRNPDYDFYWLIEHDVRFSGDWRLFFDAFAESRSDLLGTSLRDHADDPKWEFWHTLTVPGEIEIDPRHEAIGFFPVLRLSRDALKTLHEAYLQGFGGHFEATIPTLLKMNGLTIEDVGSHGRYVAASNKGRFYTNTPLDSLLSPGSFVFRPLRSEVGSEPNMLWHPVKNAHHKTWKHNRWAAMYGRFIRRGMRFFSR